MLPDKLVPKNKTVIWTTEISDDSFDRNRILSLALKLPNVNNIDFRLLGRDDAVYDDSNHNLLFVDVVYLGSIDHWPAEQKKIYNDLLGSFVQSKKDMGIVFWFASEGDSLWQNSSGAREKFPLLKDHKKFYVSGNLNVKEFYSDNWPDLDYEQMYSLNSFENTMPPQELLLPDLTIDNKDDFICLMRKTRPHRTALYLKLLANGLIKNTSKISYLEEFYTDTDITYFFDQTAIYLDDSNNEVDMLNSLCYDDVNFKITQDELSAPLVHKNAFLAENSKTVYFNLVSETWINNLFITEKTYHSICYGMPFIVWGEKGTLNELKKQGYRTFNRMFDESYDECDDPVVRLKKIIRSVREFCEKTKEEKDYLYSEAVPIIKHNQMNYIKRQDIYEKEFVEIIEDITLRISK